MMLSSSASSASASASSLSKPRRVGGNKNRSKYRSARAVVPPSHVVTNWTRTKVLILLTGALLLALLMILPLYLLDLPDSNSNSYGSTAATANKKGPPTHVGLGSLLHQSGQIRQHWKGFVEKEKTFLRHELEKDLPALFHHQNQEFAAIDEPTTKPSALIANQEISKPTTKYPVVPKTAAAAVPKVVAAKTTTATTAKVQKVTPVKDDQPDLARGVAGLPMQLTPALKGARAGHITCKDSNDGTNNFDDMAYWNYPQGTRDQQFTTPFSAPNNANNKFISYEPDLGGWNNVRMSFETLVVYAAATGRTLILPPREPFYLLAMGKDGAREFGSFYRMDQLKERVSIITMVEFITLHGKEILNLTDEEMDVLLPLAELCIHKQDDPTNCDVLWAKFRPVGFQPEFRPAKQCLVFDERVFEASGSSSGSTNEAEDDPTMLVPEDTQESVKRFCGDEREVIYYNQTYWTDPPLIHWLSGDLEYRLLNHFYTTFYFTNAATDNYFKRLVRDLLHYQDDIYCAAGKVVHALQEEFGSVSTWHVRRGDFQYKVTRLSIDEWYDNTKAFLHDGEVIYIATDEHNRTFFEPLTTVYGHPVKYLDDYTELAGLDAMDPTYLGMVDTIVASYGRTFSGTWFSTFTGYINRLRGYRGLSMKDSYYSWLDRKDRMQTWEYPNGNYPAREWQLAWTGIDGDEWIEHETREETAESAMEDEAGLDDTGGAADDEVDAEETEPVDRKVPTTFTIDQMKQDTEFVSKPMARGVSGRPISETPALTGGSRAHVQCDINVDSLAYWNDPQGKRDDDFVSPFAVDGSEKYITFGIDRGGWNNVRMSMEIIFIIALVSGRTLVLPPEIKLYLLHHDTGKKTRGFADFFPLHTPEFAKKLKIITMTEFIEREGGPNGRVPLPEGRNRTTIQKAAEHCDNRAKSDRSCMTINGFLKSSGTNPGFRAIDGCVVFDATVYAGQRTDSDAAASARNFCGERSVTYWTKEMNEPVLLHFDSDNKYYRLLTHFYSMLHFTDPAIDNYVKRFVRDFLHYNDAIYCAAGKIVKALQYEAKQRGHEPDEEGAGGYSVMHIRRGDLQYKKVKLPAKIWWNNTKELWNENEIIYIATDERNLTWFNPIARKRTVRFLGDYWDIAELGKVDPNYMGMIDTIVASRARVFAGTWFSTFSGYINRMRGYHGLSMYDSWYSFLPRKTALHNWTDVDHYAYAYEWPTGWVGIDGDVVPSKEVF